MNDLLRVGHAWYEQVQWLAGQRCSSVQCRRCKASPEVVAPDGITFKPVRERAVRRALAGLPGWLVDEGVAWIRAEEACGRTFITASAAADAWIDHAQQVLPTHDIEAARRPETEWPS